MNILDASQPAGSTMMIIELRKEDRASQSGKCDIPIKTFDFLIKFQIFSLAIGSTREPFLAELSESFFAVVILRCRYKQPNMMTD